MFKADSVWTPARTGVLGVLLSCDEEADDENDEDKNGDGEEDDADERDELCEEFMLAAMFRVLFKFETEYMPTRGKKDKENWMNWKKTRKRENGNWRWKHKDRQM